MIAAAPPAVAKTATTPADPTTATQAGTVVPPPPGSACGQTIDLPAQRSLGIGGAPLAIGDSVLYDAARPLAEYGFHVNAMVCRTMAQGIVWLVDHEQQLPVLVVVALGTNGSVSAGQIDQLLSILGPHRFLALVTPHNGNYAYVPGLMRAAARRYPYRIEALDWDRRSASHPEWFASDGIHLGGSAGIAAFAQLVASALLGPSGSSSPATAQTPSRTIRPSSPPPVHRAPPQPTAPRPPARPRVQHLPAGSLDAAAATLAVTEALLLSLVRG
jgi:hypothetical protein